MRRNSTILLLLLGLVLPAILEAQTGRLRTENMFFPPTPVGLKKDLEVRIDGLQGTGKFIVRDTCDAPYMLKTRLQDLDIDRGSVRIRVEFHPTAEGTFPDELVLEREPALQPTNDVIRIRLNGTGFALTRDERLEFGDVMTGDSTRRLVLVRTEFAQNFSWKVEGSLDRPFTLVNPNAPIPVNGGDTLGFIFSFAPTSAGTFTDSLRIIRRLDQPGNKPLDTIMVYVRGSGVRMPGEATSTFTGIMVGMTRRDTVEVDLPAPVRNAAFSYTVTSNDAASPCTARIITPTGASKAQRIAVEITCSPTTYGSGRYGFTLVRLGGVRPLDSTAIVVNVSMIPRPVRLTLGFTSDTLRARIGDTVDLDVVATTTDPIDEPIALRSYTFGIGYNPTVVVPALGADQTREVEDDRATLRCANAELNGSLVIDETGRALTTVRAAVVLGDADHSPLALGSAQIVRMDGRTQLVEVRPSVLIVENVWRYQDGTPRYVNPMAGGLVANVDPNPVVGSSTLTVDNVPQQSGRLVVVDALGQVRADLTNALRSGTRTFSIASSGTADVVVPTGTYYARLLVEGSTGTVIHSIVRVFVVQ